LYSIAVSSKLLILPLLPPWPPIRLILNSIGLPEVEYSLNFGAYFAGSKY